MGIPIALAPLSYTLMFFVTMASLYGLYRDQGFVQSGMFHMGAVLQQKEYHRIFTSAFLHADAGHLLVNMLTLFFFGPYVEALYGTAGFALILLGSQLGAEGLTIFRKRYDLNYSALGASGFVSGIVLAFCVVRPFDLIYFFFVLPIPAILFAVLYMAYSSYAMGGQGRVAHEAHLGGAISGAIIALFLIL